MDKGVEASQRRTDKTWGEPGRQLRAGARGRRALLPLCLLAKVGRQGYPWWGGPEQELGQLLGQVRSPGKKLSLSSLHYSFCFLFLTFVLIWFLNQTNFSASDNFCRD